MDQLKAHFRKTFDKTGIALTARQLVAYAKSKSVRGVTAAEIGKFVSGELSTAKFAPVRRPKHFQTIGVLRPSVYFIDYAEFRPDLARHNKGNTGFLVAVENLTNKLFVLPCRDKASQSWFDAVQSFIELSRYVRTIFSDRDAVATAPDFRQTMIDNFRLGWYFLKKGSKSYLAERYVGFVKTKLSQAILHKETKNWIQFVPALVSTYNSEKIEDTPYTRQSVNRVNFDAFLAAYFKSDQPELAFNASKAGPFAQTSWNKKIFKFDLGEKVLLARSANWKATTAEGGGGGGAFAKASVQGGFGDKVFTISGRQLRKTKGLKNFVTVYSLAEMGPSLHFYQKELKAVNSD